MYAGGGFCHESEGTKGLAGELVVAALSMF
jgi:hypothetical protein